MEKKCQLITTEDLVEETGLINLLSDLGLDVSKATKIDNDIREKGDLLFIQTREITNQSDDMICYDLSIPEKKTASESEFISFLNHELRSPLNGIMGFLKLLEDEDLTETQKKYFNYVNESCQSLEKTIENLAPMISNYFN